MNTHRVVRDLPGPDGPIPAGSTVDASGWRNAALLERQRYLERLSNPDGRKKAHGKEKE